MKLLVDANIPASDACFACLGQVRRQPGREIDAVALADVDALIIRSITRLDADTIEAAKRQGSPLSFVGTCTIGTDHVDLGALERHGIGFASAPGCNAEPVVDYVLSSLLLAMERRGERLVDKRVGVVGVGNVGGRLASRLEAMGVEVWRCDPPRAEQQSGQSFEAQSFETQSFETQVCKGQVFHDLDSLIAECDVLCLHTPLVRDGIHATHHLLGARRIAALRPGTVLLNAGRGDCIDGAALKCRLVEQGDLTVLLDVWENEPAIDTQLAGLVDLATPHVAGHSLEGKLRGSWQIHQQLVAHLGQAEQVSMAELTPPAALRRIELDAGLEPEEALRLCMRAIYDPRRDHDRLASAMRHLHPARGFDACRASYPLRREFATLEVALSSMAVELSPWLAGAGFRVTTRG